ncbi:LOW QUALITY PROTEIN: epsin-2-like [Plectropomus leopardus]|uniref:LOW QUALITY PROTEIN: epsin-2-like n=1 Tax=Plectropomus leopardus TaxID=160734 RepID=UPI001C4C3517|nr:LOW QUALITY PROTEIN: epsin-2-like [Plectropomus leopardus]
MTSSMLRRQAQNLVQNYSEAEVKVREATSNDPWGPSSTQMADLSDLTYNVVACNEIMTMLWKRLKDDKNWRHIHKSLTLLEYLLKTGDDRVLLKMKDNIYIVKALTEYRFVEKDGKDQGVNVREKAKVVLVLMEDDEKLKEERDFAFKTREKTSKGSAASSTDAIKDPNYKPCYVPGASGLPSLDNIPSVADLTASFNARKEERLKQEAEKKEVERRAKMSEDELKWEDAGKGGEVKGAWGQEKEKEEEEEAKPDPWGAPKEPKEATDPWGTPAKPDTTEKAASSDPWGAPTKTDEDPFSAPKTDEDAFAENGEDPFAAPKDESDPFSAKKDDPFNTPKDTSDPFNAPKDKEDPFAAPKDKPDPFSSSNNDPFNTPKDDPFSAPKDDPFNAPKDDPFNAPKDDPFNAPKDDPFNAPKDDPFSAPKDDPFNAPKGDPFSAPKDDPFSAPKNDPFNAPKDDPFNTPKDEPFNAPKDDPFSTPKDDPFTAPASTPPKEDPFAAPASSKDDPFTATTTPPKEDPFSAPTKPTQDDPFTAPTSPPKDDPFAAPSKTTKDDPFAAPAVAPKEDPFAAPSSPPKDDASDPFNAPPVSSPQGGADAWGAPASSPPATGSDPWGAPSTPKETTSGDPWGDGTSATSPVDPSDGFGDSSKPDDDPWGAPAAAPVSTDDAWGSPAPPSASSPSSDPFGDGASKKSDPWGAPSNGTGKRAAQEEKTRSFLGSAGASLVDLDDLFSSNPKPKQRPLVNAPVAQTQAIGTFRGMTSGPGVSSGAVAGVAPPEASTPHYGPFGSTFTPSFGAPSPNFGAIGACHSGLNMLQAAQVAPPGSGNGMVESISVGGSPQIGFNPPCGGLVQSGSLVGNPLADPIFLGARVAQSSFFGGSHQAGAAHLGGSTPQAGGGVPVQPQVLPGSVLGETVNKNTNPFLF